MTHYVPAENAFYCPQGQQLRYQGLNRQAQGYVYSSTPTQCRGCPQKQRCTSGPERKLSVDWHEPARQTVRTLADTPAYARSQRARRLVEGLFGELKEQLRVRRARLRRLWNVAEQFRLAATAQNLKRLVRFLARGQPPAAVKTA